MTDIYQLAPKSSGATPVAKLCRMLRSMLRSWPRAHLSRTAGGFGVSLDEQTYMRVSYSGRWTDMDMRDCLALFATWLVAEPGYLVARGEPLAGVLQTVERESAQSSMPQE
jgi:hypothetical protein